MTASETSRDINERPSSIVRIAYHQSSVMRGTNASIVPANVPPAGVDATGCDMTCLQRLLGLPVFVSVTSAFRYAYATTKGSHESVASILNRAEDGMRAGLGFASPVTNKIAGALETPLKVVDNAVCTGLDFVEENVPSVKLPPGQIYTNMKDSVRNIFTSALESLRLLFGGRKNQIEGLSDANGATPKEIEKVSS